MNKQIFTELEQQSKLDGVERFVVAAIIVDQDNFLLLQRPKDDFMGGIYELPSGKVENNETLENALIREVLEETGLSVQKILDYVGHFEYLSKSGQNTRQFNFTVEISKPYDIKLSEHDSYIWTSIHDLSQYNVTDSTKSILEKIGSPIP